MTIDIQRECSGGVAQIALNSLNVISVLEG